MKKTLLTLSLLISSITVSASDSRSPFTDVLYDALPSVTVQYNNENYYLLAAAGVKRADIMKSCEETYKQKCQYMFAENFLETMKNAGIDVGQTISLKLYKMDGHQILNIEEAAVTSANQEDVIINRALRGEE